MMDMMGGPGAGPAPAPGGPGGQPQGGPGGTGDPMANLEQNIQAMPREELEMVAIELATELRNMLEGGGQGGPPAPGAGGPGGPGGPPMA